MLVTTSGIWSPNSFLAAFMSAKRKDTGYQAEARTTASILVRSCSSR